MSAILTARLVSRPTACLVLAAFGAVSMSGPTGAEGVPRNLSCTFENGTAGSYESGAFVPSTPQALAFSIRNIDLEGQVAELVTDEAKAPGTLRIVRALNANHFIEAVTEGFLNLTTVYDADPTDTKGRLPAVHSRHFGVLGQAVYAQYTGFCSIETGGTR